METKLKAVYELTKVFSAIGHITDEAMLCFKPSGLEIREMDNSNISMLSVAMQPSLLTEYVANVEVKAGVNLENLNKMLKTIPKGEEFTIRINNNAIEINTKHKSFSLPIIEMKQRVDKDINLESTNTIIFNVAEFRDALKDLSQISDYAHINISNGNLTLDAEGESGSVENEYNNKVIRSIKPITNLCFNIAEMQKLIKEANKKSNIEIYLNNNEPLKVVYELAGQKLRGFLAPYIASEDA
jgi:proliferating cell nuclear antigen PCNA